MVRFQCQHCGAKLQVSEAHAGKKGRCPRCTNALAVPPVPEPELELVKEDTSAEARTPLAVRPQPLPLGQEDDSREHRLASLSPNPAPEDTGERRLPWPIDILLYPASMGGLTTLAIMVGIPLLLEVIPLLSMLLWPVGIVISLYSIWYLAECVCDSAKGGTRAPMALDTADLGEMGSRVLYLAAVYLLFVFPALLYGAFVNTAGAVFWGLVAWAVIFFPMGLLAMVIHDSTSALNPLFLLGAILRTFVPYVGLLLLVGMLAGLYWLIPSLRESESVLGWFLDALRSFLTAYLSFVVAHVLGRFYWRCRERLDWAI
ncbi:MAG: hypothetical protein NTZ17_20160 [Phycisphaerae bacterium]|nr:hypothetical protein [Phycisphaerae bacterium]